MITEITVDGFRSLSSFSMPIKLGLNILVGPNGSGKTNIILFFEFLSRIATDPLSEAISKCGGAGSIFQKTNEGGLENRFSASIEGSIHENLERDHKEFSYIFDFTVEISEERDEIYYKEQRFRFFSRSLRKNQKELGFRH